MKSRFSIQTFAATALATALFAGAAIPAMAQTAPAVPPAASADAKPGQHHRGHERMTPEQRQERMAKRAADLKQKLQITPDQEGAWTTFQAAMHPADKGAHARADRKALEGMTTPERIDHLKAMHAQRAAEMDRRGEAVKTFYAALKPEQQKVFDQESARMHERYGHHGKHDGEHKGKPQPRPAG